MKTFLAFITVLFSLNTFSQDIPAAQVPPAVIKTFKQYFPHTSNVEWEKKGNQYEAEFDVKRADHKALFESNGKLIVYKKDIPHAQLPAAVKQVLRSQYKDYKIEDTDLIARGGHAYYQVELDGKPQDLTLVFTRDGKLDNSKGW